MPVISVSGRMYVAPFTIGNVREYTRESFPFSLVVTVPLPASTDSTTATCPYAADDPRTPAGTDINAPATGAVRVVRNPAAAALDAQSCPLPQKLPIFFQPIRYPRMHDHHVHCPYAYAEHASSGPCRPPNPARAASSSMPTSEPYDEPVDELTAWPVPEDSR